MYYDEQVLQTSCQFWSRWCKSSRISHSNIIWRSSQERAIKRNWRRQSRPLSWLQHATIFSQVSTSELNIWNLRSCVSFSIPCTWTEVPEVLHSKVQSWSHRRAGHSATSRHDTEGGSYWPNHGVFLNFPLFLILQRALEIAHNVSSWYSWQDLCLPRSTTSTPCNGSSDPSLPGASGTSTEQAGGAKSKGTQSTEVTAWMDLDKFCIFKIYLCKGIYILILVHCATEMLHVVGFWNSLPCLCISMRDLTEEDIAAPDWPPPFESTGSGMWSSFGRSKHNRKKDTEASKGTPYTSIYKIPCILSDFSAKLAFSCYKLAYCSLTFLAGADDLPEGLWSFACFPPNRDERIEGSETLGNLQEEQETQNQYTAKMMQNCASSHTITFFCERLWIGLLHLRASEFAYIFLGLWMARFCSGVGEVTRSQDAWISCRVLDCMRNLYRNLLDIVTGTAWQLLFAGRQKRLIPQRWWNWHLLMAPWQKSHSRQSFKSSRGFLQHFSLQTPYWHSRNPLSVYNITSKCELHQIAEWVNLFFFGRYSFIQFGIFRGVLSNIYWLLNRLGHSIASQSHNTVSMILSCQGSKVDQMWDQMRQIRRLFLMVWLSPSGALQTFDLNLQSQDHVMFFIRVFEQSIIISRKPWVN